MKKTTLLKFFPLMIFAGMIIYFRMDLLLAAPIATFAAIGVYMFTQHSGFDGAFSHGLAAASSITMVFFVLMFAYGVAECFMATGVGAALINLSLRLGVTGRTIAPVTLLFTSILSLATGSSWGSFAACAPIFLWLNHLTGGDVRLTLCAVAGGACFGDNIGMISGVTVLSCSLQDVSVLDRTRHQSVWCLLCLLLSLLLFLWAGWGLPHTAVDASGALEAIPQPALDALALRRPSAMALMQQVKSGVPLYMVLPLLLVISMSFQGCHTLLCLGAGMVSSLLLGMAAGTISLSSWLEDLLFKGFTDAGSWTIIMMMWVAAFGGVMNGMDAFAPLADLVARRSKNVQQLMGWCGVLCFVGNMALADESAQVTTISPIVRDTVEKNVVCENREDAYTLRMRLSVLTSSMGVYGSQLIPWHCYPVFFASIANTVYPICTFTPFDIIRRNYLSFLIVGSLLLLTFTGWDRAIPFFALPKGVKLKKR